MNLIPNDLVVLQHENLLSSNKIKILIHFIFARLPVLVQGLRKKLLHYYKLCTSFFVILSKVDMAYNRAVQDQTCVIGYVTTELGQFALMELQGKSSDLILVGGVIPPACAPSEIKAVTPLFSTWIKKSMDKDVI